MYKLQCGFTVDYTKLPRATKNNNVYFGDSMFCDCPIQS